MHEAPGPHTIAHRCTGCWQRAWCAHLVHILRAMSAQAAPRLLGWCYFGTKTCYSTSKPIFKGFSQLKHFQSHRTWTKPFNIECLIHFQLKTQKLVHLNLWSSITSSALIQLWKILSQTRISIPFCHKLINSQSATQFNIIFYSKPSWNTLVQI